MCLIGPVFVEFIVDHIEKVISLLEINSEISGENGIFKYVHNTPVLFWRKIAENLVTLQRCKSMAVGVYMSKLIPDYWVSWEIDQSDGALRCWWSRAVLVANLSWFEMNCLCPCGRDRGTNMLLSRQVFPVLPTPDKCWCSIIEHIG